MKTTLRHSGYSVIELMIAMSLGVLVTGGMVSLFIAGKQSYSETERAARMQENGRTALYVLADELRHANFWGPVIDNRSIRLLDNDTNEDNNSFSGCASWAYAPVANSSANLTADPLVGSDSLSSLLAMSNLSTDCTSDVANISTNSSIVAIKRVSSGTATWSALSADELMMRGNSGGAMMARKAGSSSILPAPYTGGPSASQTDWYYRPKIFFVSNASDCGTTSDNTPTLCVAEGTTAVVQSVYPLVNGIEVMHIEYGIDTDDDGAPNAYYTSTNAVTGVPVTANVYLLLRDPTPDYHYIDENCYTLGSKTYPDPADCVEPFTKFTGDDRHYHRTQFSTAVILHNMRNN